MFKKYPQALKFKINISIIKNKNPTYQQNIFSYVDFHNRIFSIFTVKKINFLRSVAFLFKV